MVKFPLTGLDMTPPWSAKPEQLESASHWSQSGPHRTQEGPLDYIYDLYAVCNHHGTMQGGHYTGLQRAKAGACADGPRRVVLATGWLC